MSRRSSANVLGGIGSSSGVRKSSRRAAAFFSLGLKPRMPSRIFVAALGASSYPYAEARWSETLPDWIGAHVNAFEFLGGVPKAAVPDNLKAGITKPSRYEPGVNRTYQDLADHYGFVVLPARVRRPRDKAKVEAAVGIVSRFVLGKLRNRRFFSLA